MPNKVKNTEDFIVKARKIHGNKYDYSLVDYKKSNINVKIICLIHGVFEQVPNSHLNGRGCSECGREKTIIAQTKYDLNGFIEEAQKIHKNKYDYSKVKYKDTNTKIDIICPKHGVFEQKPSKHLRGQGCERCARELSHYNQLTTDSFIKKARLVHGVKYDYSLVDYKKSNIKIKIICQKHGIFEQTPNNHLMGMRCIKCANEENGINRRLTTQEFIAKSQKRHGTKYGYSMIDYVDLKTKVKIICPIHGIFIQNPCSHYSGKGCPACNESQGERKIVSFLDSYHIEYVREKNFKKCRNKGPLFFDFYVSQSNVCIEYDGKQHFYPVDYFGGVSAFDQLKKSDAIKNAFCLDNNIKLIRIPYTKKDELESILRKELCLDSHKECLSAIDSLL